MKIGFAGNEIISSGRGDFQVPEDIFHS